MNITIDNVNAISVMSIVGRVDSSTAPELERQLSGHIDNLERLAIVLDFSQVDYISSAGLRAVLIGAKRVKARRGTLVLCSMNSTVYAVFASTGFDKIVDIYPDFATAVAQCSQ